MDIDGEGKNGNGKMQAVLDVAHTLPAMDYLVTKLRRTHPDSQFRLVGMSNGKDLKLCGQWMLNSVKVDASRIHLVEASPPRAAKLEKNL